MQRVTPGTESRRGLSVQSANVRSSIGESFSATSPTLSKSIVAETSGDIVGAFTPVGRARATVPSFSASIWRAMWMSVPSLKTTVTTDRPWMDSERRDSSEPRPFTAVSMGRVTSASTCSGVMPGASACTVTCGGTKSGNTSSFECFAT